MKYNRELLFEFRTHLKPHLRKPYKVPNWNTTNVYGSNSNLLLDMSSNRHKVQNSYEELIQ